MRAARRSSFWAPMVFGLALSLSAMASAEDEIDPSRAADEVGKLQERMQDDPEIMDAVEDLRDDPVVRDVLDDPSVAQALRSGDFGSLLLNPKIQQLMEHPSVRDITRELED